MSFNKHESIYKLFTYDDNISPCYSLDHYKFTRCRQGYYYFLLINEYTWNPETKEFLPDIDPVYSIKLKADELSTDNEILKSNRYAKSKTAAISLAIKSLKENPYSRTLKRCIYTEEHIKKVLPLLKARLTKERNLAKKKK